MSQVKKVHRLLGLTLAVVIVLTGFNLASNQVQSQTSQVEMTEITGEDVLLFDNQNFTFSYKASRDILSIFDKRNDYLWQTGLNIAAPKDVKKAFENGEDLGFEPIEERMNTTFTNMANSLITVEYYDASMGIKRSSSASEDNESKLYAVDGVDNHFALITHFKDIDIKVTAHLIFNDQGYQIRIEEGDLTGEGKAMLAGILLHPFLGASGGQHALYNEQSGTHDEPVAKPVIEGYVLVPDGPGALIPFRDYSVSIKEYTQEVYGQNPAKATYHENQSIDLHVPFKSPLMPVFGIAHTDHKAAFLGYAVAGDAHMEVVVMPEDNTTFYTWAYPRFVYNAPYYQVFNKQGEGYFKLKDQPEAFDLAFNYHFLGGDQESPDYSGMARAYKDYLIETGVLAHTVLEGDMPVRLDMMMSDQKKSVIGLENVVVTEANQVKGMTDALMDQGLKALSVGLLGWQDGGLTSGKAWKADFDGAIGTKSDFKALLAYAQEKNIDMSFYQDYITINDKQASETRYASKHVNSWFVKRHVNPDYPIHTFNYAQPQVALKWVTQQVEDLSKLNLKSHTLAGVSSLLHTHNQGQTSEEEGVIGLYQEALGALNQDLELNLTRPNQYLWQVTDRFLQAPVFHSKYLIESEPVPFLQMVLKGTMEVFSPYANFSFSGQQDVLALIDYNMSPAYILTHDPAYELSTTNAMDLYSTEYGQYQDLIVETYGLINDALGPVRDADWLSREKVGDKVYMNTYSNGVKIIINYSDQTIHMGKHKVGPLSYKHIQ